MPLTNALTLIVLFISAASVAIVGLYLYHKRWVAMLDKGYDPDTHSPLEQPLQWTSKTVKETKHQEL